MLVPIHRDTQIDLKTEKGFVKVHNNTKKGIENQGKKEKEAKFRLVSGVIARTHSEGHQDRLENRKGRRVRGHNKKRK